MWVTDKFHRSDLRNLVAGSVRHAAKRVGIIDSPPSHQASAHWVLSRYISFEGKEVLEIGGSQSGEAALPFLSDGATRVSITGLDHVTEEKLIGEKLRILRANALSLSSVFQPDSFDVVYGLSIVEHIPSPKVFLDEVHRVLKPGGIAYFEGNPVWTSPKGHHLWVATWGGLYEHKATANYLFNRFPNAKSTNPLPDWSHILMTEAEMREHLDEKGLPQIDIECIIDWVYLSDQINRLGMSEVAEAYSTSKLVVLEANTVRVQVPPEVEKLLRQHRGESIDYGISGVSYVLAKR
jgi:ubiquinone/menaquinone biosynthesis C-methylase UbiE